MTGCTKCGGSGVYSYDENHSKPCEECCQHDEGRWLLTKEYAHEGKWCCKRGCGHITDNEDGTNEDLLGG